MRSLAFRAWLGLAVVVLIMGAVIFGCAGTLAYAAAWAYLALYLVLAGIITLDLQRHDPALLERRVKGGPTAERRPTERFIMVFASIGFLSLMVIPGLDFREHWSSVPVAGVVIGDLLFIIGFGFVGRVLRENTYASATIELAAGQHVIDTGPYGIVRHPMYASALLYLIGTPLGLGSWWSFLGLAFMLPFLIWRILDEEHLLSRDLTGYAAYATRVRYRLIPGIW